MIARRISGSIGNRIHLLACLPLFLGSLAHGDTDNLKLWYDKPATAWEQEALPIGNGQMGAMLFGGDRVERVQFNEESLWIGNEEDTGAYQNFGEVQVRFDGGALVITNPSNHPSPGNETVQMTGDGRPGTKWCIEHGGRFPGYPYDDGKKSWLPLNREARLRILHDGGKVTVQNGRIRVEQSNTLTLLLAAGTDFLQDRSQNWRGPLPHDAIAARLVAAAKNPYAGLLDEHLRDYRRLFGRVEHSLGGETGPGVADGPPAQAIPRRNARPGQGGADVPVWPLFAHPVLARRRAARRPAGQVESI